MSYISASEHLKNELLWLKHIIVAHVLRLRYLNFYEGLKDFREFFISDEEIDILLTGDIFERKEPPNNERKEKVSELLKQASEIRNDIIKNIKESIAQKLSLPIARITWCYQLTDFEVLALIICMAPQVDSRYEKIYAYLQNDSTKRLPTVDLIFNLMDLNFEERISAREYFSPQAPLFKFGILEFLANGDKRETSLLSNSLKLNERIANYLLGIEYIDKEFEQVAKIYSQEHKFPAFFLQDSVKENLKKFITWYNSENSKKKQNIIFFFYGPNGAGKQETAGMLCQDIGLPLLIIDLEAIQNFDLPWKQTLEMAFRESLLLPAVLYFKNAESMLNEGSHYHKEIFFKTVNEKSWLSFISSTHLIDLQGQLSDQRFIQIEFTIPDYKHRQQLWRFYLGNETLISKEVDLDTLATKFNFTPGQIRDAVEMAINRSLYKFGENRLINNNDLYECCWAQSNQKLKTLSQKIKPKYIWKDIVLPQEQMAQLREITNFVKYKHLVYSDWGFDRKLSLGKGLNIFFTGPSGTGKTMAAEVMANELKLDLYKIDLSTVVSKYIGETEKNLSKIFQEAETSNSILFFDEADALFGKRSEVKDAHDRYANIEIGYLLQKMDEYIGIVILATNLRKNIDEAFERRMHFTLEFPFPEELDRLRIWQNIYPKETPLNENIDFNFLSRRFKMTGGNIKNVALAAAFFAANDGKIVTMEHLIRAIKREYQKIGKLCVKADFGDYYDVVQK